MVRQALLNAGIGLVISVIAGFILLRVTSWPNLRIWSLVVCLSALVVFLCTFYDGVPSPRYLSASSPAVPAHSEQKEGNPAATKALKKDEGHWNSVKNVVAAIERSRDPSQKITVTQRALVAQTDSTRPPREVDVLVSIPLSDRTMTIGLDVLDEAEPVQVTMIEQRRQMKEKLKLDRYCLVSMSDLVGEARREAELANIEVVTLEELAQPGWLARTTIRLQLNAFSIVSLRMKFGANDAEFDRIDDYFFDSAHENRLPLRKEIEKQILSTWQGHFRELAPLEMFNVDFASNVLGEWRQVYRDKTPLGTPTLVNATVAIERREERHFPFRTVTSKGDQTYLTEVEINGAIEQLALVVRQTGADPMFKVHATWTMGPAKPEKDDKSTPDVWFAPIFDPEDRLVREIGDRISELYCVRGGPQISGHPLR